LQSKGISWLPLSMESKRSLADRLLKFLPLRPPRISIAVS
jgi:hypothetical protein